MGKETGVGGQVRHQRPQGRQTEGLGQRPCQQLLERPSWRLHGSLRECGCWKSQGDGW